MFIKNKRMLEADTGAGVNGAGNTGNTDTTTQTDNVDTSNTETTKTEKTFTQKDVDKLIQERVAAEERALLAETKVTCLSKGVVATSVDDVVILAKAMVTGEVTIENAIDKVLEKYPSFKGEQQQEEQKGFVIGAGSQKQKESSDNALARAFGNK